MVNQECTGKIFKENVDYRKTWRCDMEKDMNIVIEERYEVQELKRNWTIVLEYVRDNSGIMDLAYHTWIEPLEAVSCEQECIVLRFTGNVAVEIIDYTVKYIKNKFGKVLLEAYNLCHKSNLKGIEICY